MQISKVSFSHLQNVQNIQHIQQSNISFANRTATDSFTKSISFGEIKNPKIEKALDVLATGGAIGVPLLLSIAGGIWLANGDDPSIYLQNRRYVYDPAEESVKSEDINIDPHKGIYKIAGTKIDIRPEKYDFVDIEKGIFKNYDGSVDIDLGNQKFIDINNGIFIDPVSQISAIQDGNTIKDIIIPSFKGAGGPNMGPMEGPTIGEMKMGNGGLTRSEYIRRFKVKPENSEYADRIERSGKIHHDKESFWDRMKEFFTGDNGNRYDVFGRKIYSYTDANGNIFHFPMDEETAHLVENHLLDVEKVPELIKAINEYKNELFLKTFKPVYLSDTFDYTNHEFDGTSDTIAEHAQNIIDQTHDAVSSSAPPGIWEEIHEHLANILENGIG